MSFIPNNQTVSFTVYVQAITNALPVPHDFLEANSARIQKMFEMGEPIWMAVEELKVRWEHRVRTPKTPRALALRVVKVGQ